MKDVFLYYPRGKEDVWFYDQQKGKQIREVGYIECFGNVSEMVTFLVQHSSIVLMQGCQQQESEKNIQNSCGRLEKNNFQVAPEKQLECSFEAVVNIYISKWGR